MSLRPRRNAARAGSVRALRMLRSFSVIAGVGMLVACTAPLPDPSIDRETTPPGEGVFAPSAGAAGAAGAGLRPLVRELAVPPGAPPRSTVARVNYELSSSGPDLPPDDGLPGDDAPPEIFQRGGASWYGIQFHQRRTANGERFDMSAFTAAHRTLPFGTAVCVRSLTNGREVLVRVNDRGPFSAGRIIDLSRAAAEAIDMVGLGIKQVAITVIEGGNMRCGGVAVDLAALAAQASTGDEATPPPAAPPAARRVSKVRPQR